MGYYAKRMKDKENSGEPKPTFEVSFLRYRVIKSMLDEDPELRKEIKKYLELYPSHTT